MSDLHHCLNYLKKNHVLTLCTGSGDTLWAANCFYVLDETGIAFWLMTEETTRHGEFMRLNPRVAGTVTTPTRSVMKIQGIQYAGEIFRPEGEREKQALACYQQHFPIARAMKAPLWEIRLDELKMTDNTLGFGKKSTGPVLPEYLSWRLQDAIPFRYSDPFCADSGYPPALIFGYLNTRCG